MNDLVAHTYLLRGIQFWGQSAEERESATRAFVEAAGLKFGSTEANAWTASVLRTLRRGKFEDEISQLQAAIDARKTAQAQL